MAPLYSSLAFCTQWMQKLREIIKSRNWQRYLNDIRILFKKTSVERAMLSAHRGHTYRLLIIHQSFPSYRHPIATVLRDGDRGGRVVFTERADLLSAHWQCKRNEKPEQIEQQVLWDANLSARFSFSLSVILVHGFRLHIGVGYKFPMDRYLETDGATSMGLFL